MSRRLTTEFETHIRSLKRVDVNPRVKPLKRKTSLSAKDQNQRGSVVIKSSVAFLQAGWGKTERTDNEKYQRYEVLLHIVSSHSELDMIRT